MNNTFDRLKKTAFNIVKRTMGYDCTWYIDADINGRTIISKVLFNDHSQDENVGQQSYAFGRPVMEFKVRDFPGLKKSVDEGNQQLVQIGSDFFYVHEVIAPKISAKDGDTFIGILNIADEYRVDGECDC